MDATREFFDAWAEFYDADYDSQDIGDVAFYVDLAREADGPILEVGCGTGRVYLELLRAGVDAYGIDVSREMLDVLERKADREGLTPRVREADMREFAAEREYALVIVPFRAFLHNVTLTDQQAALRRFRGALADDGRLAVNFFVPNAEVICDHYGEATERTVPVDGEEWTVRDVTDFEDEVAQVVRGERTITDADGEVVETGAFRIKLVDRDEFALLLETTGWSDWAVYGGFDWQTLDSADQEMVWVAEP